MFSTNKRLGADSQDIRQGLVLKGQPEGSEFSVASRLWVGTNWLASARTQKPHSGLLDVALIAEAGKRLLGGNRAVVMA
jgi:hypothetical protein